MSKTLIIAEAGVNHNGSIELALSLIDAAAAAGADIVKFQSFSAERLVTKTAKKAKYQIEEDNADESQYEMLKKLELNEEMHNILIKHCKKRNIKFLSTGFDIESNNFLYNLGIRNFKIPSGEITNLPYLRHLGSIAESVIVSTGMSSMKEIKETIKTLIKSGMNPKKISILHCTSSYPTPDNEVNLKAIRSISSLFNMPVGYSDHTEGIHVPVAAVAIGATIIEKHFTLDRNMSGPDHQASLEPKELQEMISAIRKIEVILGDGIKKPSSSEIKNIEIVRKSIVARKDINKDEVFSINNIAIKRPGNGVSPMRWDEFIGSKATKDYLKDDLIEE